MSSAVFSAADDRGPTVKGNDPSGQSFYLKVKLDPLLNPAKLNPGDRVDGVLERDVYNSRREMFFAGDKIRLIVSRVEKRKKARNDHWPWVVNAFASRHENYPVFEKATVARASGTSELTVSTLIFGRMREVHAQAKNGSDGKKSRAVETGASRSTISKRMSLAPTLFLEASLEPTSATAEYSTPAQSSEASPKTLPAGTTCKILLTTDVSASRSHPGDAIQGRLLEPVIFDSVVALPAGSLFEGKVLGNKPPRWGSRAGALSFTFNQLTIPKIGILPVSASLASAELSRASHTRIDSEGQLHGERPGIAWMAINLGVTAGLAKEADDATQLIVEAIVESATDVSTAGSARIISSIVSGIYMVSRHGRDVVLPRFTELEISLDRPLTIQGVSPADASTLKDK